MTDRHPLDRAIREHLNRHVDIYADAGLALIAVLDVHTHTLYVADDGVEHWECDVCRDSCEEMYPWPCPTVEPISHTLGISVDPATPCECGHTRGGHNASGKRCKQFGQYGDCLCPYFQAAAPA